MSKFQAGDKVKVVSCERKSYWYSDLVGKEFILLGVDKSFGPYIQENEHFGRSFFSECDIEIVQEKEQMKSEAFNLKKNPWFIRVNNKEESVATQEWLFSNGFKWIGNNPSIVRYADSKIICNVFIDGSLSPNLLKTDYIEEIHSSAQEIKLTFKTVVDSVHYPIVKSEQQLKIEELQATIEKAQQQIEQLKGLK